MTFQTYLINLDRATDRLAWMQKNFEAEQISFERIDAVDARVLDADSYIIDNKFSRELLLPEVGCHLSHVKTLQTFLRSDHQFALVMEDDAILLPGFKLAVENSIAQRSSLPNEHQWDVLKLYNGRHHHIKIADVDDKHFLAACGLSIPITTIAAIWTREAAEKFLAKVVQSKPIVKRPIDCELQHPWEYDLRIYNLLPSLCHGDTRWESSVRVSRPKKNLPMNLAYEINRFFPKILYLIKHHGLDQFIHSFVLKKNKWLQ
jgi:glycosyl transferase family 25